METPENQGSAAIDTSGTKQSANKQSDSTSAEQQGSACGRATACAGMDVASIANRVKGMIFDPRNTWQQVKSEQQQIREIYTGFLIPLAAVATIATIIKSSVLGTSIPFVGMSVKLSFMSALTTGVISFAFQMISIYLLAAIIPMIFTSTTKEGVFRLLAFAWAPALFGSILAIVPWIGGLCALVLGLYSIYVFVVGISVVTGVQNPLGFTIVTVILAIVIGIVLGAIQGIFIPTSHQIPEVTFEGSEGGVFQLDQQKMRDLQQQLEKFAPTPP